jgi:hypothetical protein
MARPAALGQGAAGLRENPITPRHSSVTVGVKADHASGMSRSQMNFKALNKNKKK